jgi:hypothetical protein
MKSSFGLGILGLPILLMALSAINVAEAHATDVTSPLPVGLGVEIEPLGAAKEKHLVLLSTSGKNKVSILCGKIEAAGATLETEGRATTSFSLAECSTLINEKAESNCNPLSQPVKASGSIKVIKHEGVTYLKAEGASGVFATLKFNEEICVALSPVVKVTGTAWVKDAGNEWEVEKAAHLIEEGTVPAGALGGLLFGGNKASIDGSANISFNDAEHKGRNFSALAASEVVGASWMVGT